MLYAYELLCRKPKGKFAVIWCLANGMKVSNRDVMKISISDTVKELQKMIDEQEPYYAPTPYEKRLSIYLTANLCYGTVLALDRQLDNFISVLTKYKSLKQIIEELQEEEETPRDKDEGKKKRKWKRRVSEIDVTMGQIPSLDIPELGIDLVKHIEETGAAVRVDEHTITLQEDIVPRAVPAEDEGFGETALQELDAVLFPELEKDKETLQPPKTPEPAISPARQLAPSEEGVLLKSPQVAVLELPQDVEVYKSPQVVSPTRSVILPVEEVSEIVIETSVRTEPQPQPRAETQLLEEMELEPLSPEEREIERRRRRKPVLDENIQISREDIMKRARNVHSSLRVKTPQDDVVNIRMLRWIIPASHLLKSVCRNIYLKDLITRNYITERIPDVPSLLESIPLAGEAEITQPIDLIQGELAEALPPVETVQPLDVTQEEAIELALPPDDTETAQRIDVTQEEIVEPQLADEVAPDIAEREAKDLQFPATVQEEMAKLYEIRGELKELAKSPTRSEDALKAVQHIVEMIEGLSDSESNISFAVLCPPDKFDRITAMEIFEMLLDLQDKKLLTIIQTSIEYPPQLPHPPIYIYPVFSPLE